jgi:hypothetical protein
VEHTFVTLISAAPYQGDDSVKRAAAAFFAASGAAGGAPLQAIVDAQVRGGATGGSWF